jgi:predicted PurR-regulated permease PerM
MIERAHVRASNSMLVNLAAFVVIVAGLRTAQAIVVPFMVAAFLAMICLPPLHWFRNRGWPTWLALVAISAVVILIGTLVVGVFGTSVNDMRQHLPEYQLRLGDFKETLGKWIEPWREKAGFQFNVNQDGFDAQRALSLFGGLLAALGSLLGDTLIIVFMVIFMLLEAADLPGKLRAISPGSHELAERMDRIRESVWRYTSLKSLISLLTAVLVSLWLWLIGVDYPLVWGLLSFLFNFVPNIGSFIAAAPAIVMAILQPDHGGEPATLASSLTLAAYAAVGYLVINVVVGSVIEPRWLGRGLGLSTLVVFLSLVFWGWVLGPVGMLFSVPLTMVVKIVLDNSDDLQWVAILLGSDVPEEGETRVV